MKKFLLVATVVKIHVNAFHIPLLKLMKENGYEVHVCAKNDYEKIEDCIIPYCDKFYNIPFEREPIKKKNIKAYKQLKEIINDNEYDIIHCHTPVGGALTRIASRKSRKKGAKIVYTAHGFHFYKGAKKKNWLVFYPLEKMLSRLTDVLITINKEDYNLSKGKFKAKQTKYIPGVGIDIKKFNNKKYDTDKKRRYLGVETDDFVMISVGELNANKNHRIVIEALSKLKNPKIKYLICGQGYLLEELKKLTQDLGVENQVKFLGFRNDIKKLLNSSDLFVFPSYREGLSLSVMEAMASGLPVIASNIRGNRDLIREDSGGFLVMPNDSEELAVKIKTLEKNKKLVEKFGEYNVRYVKQFSSEVINEEMKKIII